MSYNWTITDGDIYVSKNGNDVAGDGSMSNPYASINKATSTGSTGDKIVIGTGIWGESRGTSVNIYKFYGDGNVIIDATYNFYLQEDGEEVHNCDIIGSGSQWLQNAATVSKTYSWFNCKIESLIQYGSKTYYLNFINCHIKKVRFTQYYQTHYWFKFINCIIEESNMFNSLGSKDLRNINFIQCHNNIFVNNIHFGGSYVTPDYNNFYNCEWATSTSNELPLSTIQNNYNSMLNSIDLDPKFNNEQIGDYTLQPDSPCLFAGKNNAHIGAYGVGYNFTANSSEFTEEGGATFSQSDIGSGLENDIVKYSANIKGVDYYYFVLNTDHTEGTIESEWIDFQTLYELNSTKLFANFIYDEDGVATSRVDMDNNNTGEFPNQYDFEMKYCINEEDKDTAAWQETIWNKELSNVSARFVKVKIYLKEN